jgi:hypothetical protein
MNRMTVGRSLGLIALLAMVAVSAAMLLQPATARGQGEREALPPPAKDVPRTAVQSAVDKLARAKFDVFGPHEVVSVSSSSLELFASPRSRTLDLEGKNVSVFDTRAQPASFSAIVPESWVTVARKGDQVFLYLTTREERGDDEEQATE